MKLKLYSTNKSDTIIKIRTSNPYWKVDGLVSVLT
jgi:hypothetical protein